MSQTVKHLPTMWETRVGSLGREDHLEKEPTPVLLPTKSHGQRSVVGYSPWGCKESDMTEPLHFPFLFAVSSTFSHSASLCFKNNIFSLSKVLLD